jgi:hypothetical protein
MSTFNFLKSMQVLILAIESTKVVKIQISTF